MIVKITAEQLEKCIEFSKECAKNPQRIEFGQSDTSERGTDEIARDNLIGKIAEVAFANMLKDNFDIEIELDFEYYPLGQWDKQDTVINGWKIDVKGTRQGGKWLLVEWNKINFRQRDKDLSHLFVMASVHWDRKNDVPTGEVDFVGCASIEKLKKNIKNTITLKKGDLLPGTKYPVYLQADNFVIKFENLENNWDFVINYLIHNNPPDVSTYPNPYDGKTYRDLFPEDYKMS